MSAQPKGLPRIDVLALIEREDELAALAAAVARLAERGAGGVVVVEAAAGLGKSVLLDRAARMAAGVGARVRRAAAGPLERDVAHDVLRALLETELCERAPQERARLLEGPAAAVGALLLEGEDAADARIGHGVVRLCAALGRERPLVLVVDDAQWCDRPSLEALGVLARRIADLPVLLLLAHRPDDPGAARDLLALAGAAPAARTLRPRPLSVAGAARLIRRVAPDTAIHVCRQGHEAAAGNPWLLGELARGAEPGAGARQVVRERLAGLSAGARSLAVALAVLGDGAEREVVAAVAGLELAALARAGDEVTAAGLLRADRRGLIHPLVRAAIAEELPTGTLDDLHRAAARCLADDDAITHHLLRCAPLGDPAVTAHLRRAAARAWQDGDPHRAVTVLERALAERAPGDPRAELLARLSTAAFDAGLPGAAGRLTEALATAGHDDRIGILTGVAAAGAAPLVVLDDAEGVPETVLLDALVALPERHAERARRIEGLRVGAEEQRFAQAHRAAVALERGVPAAAELAREALADGSLLRAARRRPGFGLALRALIFSDQEAEASRALDELRAEAERRGSPRLRASVAHHAAEMALRAGRVIDAEAYARVAGPAARAVLVAALAERGAFAEADALLGEPDDALLHARARLALARGDLDLAYADARAAGRRCAANPALTPWRATAALALAHSGRRAAAAVLAGEELALAERFGAPLAILTALHARAVAEADPTARLALLRRGAALAATAPPSAAAIALLLEEGATLRRSGDRVEAREPLRRALALATAGGADLAAQRARRELVASGARPRRDQDEGAEALTPRQREICELAAAGVTNRQIAERLFLSVKTVETHLASAFRKLGVAARAELAAALTAASGSA